MPTSETEVVTSSDPKSEALRGAILVLLVLTVAKHAAPFLGSVGAYALTAAVGFQLYYPLWRESRAPLTREELGLTLKPWKADLLRTGAWALAVTIPFAVGHHVFQTYFGRTFTLRFDPGVLESFVSLTLVIAIAEEIFFRGYLQGRLTAWLGEGRAFFGVDKAIVVTSAVFALAHFVGEYNFLRLGPFFPSLVFGLLRRRSGSVLGAIVFHAYCNLLGDVLFMFYRTGG